MLESVKISKRQSEIRQSLSELVGKTDPSEDETRSMETLDNEYRQNEIRFRAALTSEDTERREAGDDLEKRDGSEWSELIGQFEMRQVALALDEGRTLSGATAEVVEEMRSSGGYRGVPVPIEALEMRAGETVAAGTPDPITTRPIIDRIFAPTVAARMGVQFISIAQGETEWPVATSGATAGWADGETANVAGPQVYATVDKALKPDNTFGVQMKVTRKAMKQSGAALEQAVRRDMNSAIQTGLDKAIFQGSGANGEPLGIVSGAGTYGILETAVDAPASWSAFRGAIVRYMLANAISSPSDVKLLLRPEVWGAMDDALIAGTAVSEWDRLTSHVGAGNISQSSNALADPAGDPAETVALLTTNTAGVSPAFVGLWGGIDLIRDPYADAQSGGLRITALLTADVTVARSVQLEVLTGVSA